MSVASYHERVTARTFLSSGGAEVSVGGIWLLLSLVGLLGGREAAHVLLWDAATLAAVAVGVRWTSPGAVLVCLLTPLGLMVDPEGLGFSTYIVACGVVLFVRKGEVWAASLVSGVLAVTTLILSLRRMGAEPDGLVAAVVTLLIVGIAWLVGLGFRWVARVEAERVSKEYVERQMRMAVDIHDFVGRNLTGVLLMAAHASPDQMADPRFLDELVARVRSADVTLRQVTADLHREEGAVPCAPVGSVEALLEGVAELEAAGMPVGLSQNAEVPLADLPPEVDLVVSRILSEALHNVLKHADRTQACRVEVAREDGVLGIEIANGVMSRRGGAPRPRLGLIGMGRHAALAGGTVVSSGEGDGWVCRVAIPIDRAVVG